MTTVDEHLERILAAVAPTRPRRAGLEQAHGCVLAADVRATVALPSFDNSAMDGYAVRAADVAEATPTTLPVVGEIPAGPGTPAPLKPGTVVRIMTGAPLPRGADAVVQLEWTDGGRESVAVRRPADRGLHIRRAGEDVTPGALVLPAGTVIGSAQIGLLAAVNVARPPVHPRPRVAVLSTGTELVEVGSRLGAGQIVDSNSHGIAAAAREAGALVRRLTGVPDEPDAFAKALHGVLGEVDAVVTTGGVSVGAYDVVKEVLTGTGTVRFDTVAMQPGKPQGFGLVEGVPIFTLPGNPVSALVSFELFVRPALQRMRGLVATGLLRIVVTVDTELHSLPGRRTFVRVGLVHLGDDGRPGPRTVARLAGGQGSHQLTSLAGAQALVIIPEEVTKVPAGARLPALLLGADSGAILAGMGWVDTDASDPSAGPAEPIAR
ncbi:gephyrin-like molybdotransferase Glp [Candidatus Frankia alpina]|uniref:Molybdopterin molybdenumtransferase n=1 Tax=Candidatus Frankia alpina TaxID=2699483 RepID=A0A4S5ERZ5_9ACTN|nr:gephyrin-like molybdotransferase Glp [Candidatus Frankia alpina]THJ75211.1 molybdopterin molybdotransferase MoeA [Candidatus Frankia alpina]